MRDFSGGSEIQDGNVENEAGWTNSVSGVVFGPSVQAQTVHGGVHFHVTAQAKAPVPNQLLPVPANFTNRGSELARLRQALDDQGRAPAPKLMVITGVGGIGKTSLALWWLHEVRDRFPVGQLFADLGAFSAGGPIRPSDVLGRFVRALGVSPERVPADLEERAALFRSLTAGRPVIILLDDAASAAQVRSLLPGSGPGLVVVTTRRLLNGLAIDGARFVPLAPLEEQAAVELLDRIVGAGRIGSEPQAARSLVALCGRLPIAVCASGALLAPHPRRAVGRMVDELTSEGERLAVLSVTEDISVRAVFDLSFRALPADAARLYRLLGLLPGTDFGVGVAAAIANVGPAEVSGLLDALVDASLLQEIGDGQFRFHDLVRLHARGQADAESAAERHAALARGIDWYLRSAVAADLVVLPTRWRVGRYYRDPPETPVPLRGPADALAWLEEELPNLLATLHAASASGLNDVGWQLCEALWGLFIFRKHYDAWIESHRIGLACAHACGDPRAEARMHIQLGSAYRSLRRYDEAAEHFSRALGLDRACGHRLGEGSALDQLGVVALRRARYDEAIELFTASRAIHEEVGESRGVALMEYNLGQALSDSGRHREAITHFRAACRQFAGIPEPYHQARALTGLGQAHIRCGQLDEAAQPLAQALTVLGGLGASYDLAHVLTQLATLAERLGDRAAARGHLERALALFTDVGAPQVAEVRFRLSAFGPQSAPGEPGKNHGDDPRTP